MKIRSIKEPNIATRTYICGDRRAWYDRYLRAWTMYESDEVGNQIGDAFYDTDRTAVMRWLRGEPPPAKTMSQPTTKIQVHRFGQCVGIAFAPFSTDKQTEYIPAAFLPQLIRALQDAYHDIDRWPAHASKFPTAVIE